jgi:toxin ParE1/3/4
LPIDRMRCWPVQGFPHLIFNLERKHRFEVGRVLHGLRDLLAWIGETR